MAAFGDAPPARSAVAVAGLPLGALVEVEALGLTCRGLSPGACEA